MSIQRDVEVASLCLGIASDRELAHGVRLSALINESGRNLLVLLSTMQEHEVRGDDLLAGGSSFTASKKYAAATSQNIEKLLTTIAMSDGSDGVPAEHADLRAVAGMGLFINRLQDAGVRSSYLEQLLTLLQCTPYSMSGWVICMLLSCLNSTGEEDAANQSSLSALAVLHLLGRIEIAPDCFYQMGKDEYNRIWLACMSSCQVAPPEQCQWQNGKDSGAEQTADAWQEERTVARGIPPADEYNSFLDRGYRFLLKQNRLEGISGMDININRDRSGTKAVSDWKKVEWKHSQWLRWNLSHSGSLKGSENAEYVLDEICYTSLSEFTPVEERLDAINAIGWLLASNCEVCPEQMRDAALVSCIGTLAHILEESLADGSYKSSEPAWLTGVHIINLLLSPSVRSRIKLALHLVARSFRRHGELESDAYVEALASMFDALREEGTDAPPYVTRDTALITQIGARLIDNTQMYPTERLRWCRLLRTAVKLTDCSQGAIGYFEEALAQLSALPFLTGRQQNAWNRAVNEILEIMTEEDWRSTDLERILDSLIADQRVSGIARQAAILCKARVAGWVSHQAAETWRSAITGDTHSQAAENILAALQDAEHEPERLVQVLLEAGGDMLSEGDARMQPLLQALNNSHERVRIAAALTIMRSASSCNASEIYLALSALSEIALFGERADLEDKANLYKEESWILLGQVARMHSFVQPVVQSIIDAARTAREGVAVIAAQVRLNPKAASSLEAEAIKMIQALAGDTPGQDSVRVFAHACAVEPCNIENTRDPRSRQLARALYSKNERMRLAAVWYLFHSDSAAPDVCEIAADLAANATSKLIREEAAALIEAALQVPDRERLHRDLRSSVDRSNAERQQSECTGAAEPVSESTLVLRTDNALAAAASAQESFVGESFVDGASVQVLTFV